MKKLHTNILIEKVDTKLMDPPPKNRGSYPFNENLGVTKHMEALYSEARSETDFDMQESMCRKSSYVRAMEYHKQQTQHSQVTSNQERNIYNNQDKEIIRQ
jgi:hypothetical protein